MAEYFPEHISSTSTYIQSDKDNPYIATIRKHIDNGVQAYSWYLMLFNFKCLTRCIPGGQPKLKQKGFVSILTLEAIINSSPWTKMAAIPRTTFKMHFHELKILYVDSNFTQVCSYGSHWQQASIGLVNGLAPNTRQATIWTNSDLNHWRI